MINVKPAEKWRTCRHCHHRINPAVQVCDEAWQHNPCTIYGCVPEDPS